MAKGRIIKALSGYYYVLQEGDGPIIQCRARGLFKKKGIQPLVGDWVEFDHTQGDEGYITKIYSRQNELIRPPIANVDQAVLVFSVHEPPLHQRLLDKLLVHTEFAGISSLICFNKIDLISEQEKQQLQFLTDLYRKIGYPVMTTSIPDQFDKEAFIHYLKGKTSVFAGQSGVGKSSILKKIFPDREIEVGKISDKLGRGKHTTRHVELLPLQVPEGGLVADTPGFSQLDFHEMTKEDLSLGFIEMKDVAVNCKFRGCLHLSEPSCAVREAVDKGEINASRYVHYKQFLQEIEERKRRY